MATTEETKKKLEVKRKGYDAECTWMRLLLDSYTGGGGFQGRVQQPDSGFWGQAAEAYASFSPVALLSMGSAEKCESGTYLDRFPREDGDKFSRRRNVAHYRNYVKPTTNLKVSYIVRKPFTRSGVPEKLQKWIDSTRYDSGFRKRALLASVLGWFPMLVDKPAANPDARTAAEVGNLEPYGVEMLPCQLVDYRTNDDGTFAWAKTCVSTCEKATWDAPEVKVDVYTIWAAKTFRVFTVRRPEGGKETIEERPEAEHAFGRVPIVSWRADTSVDDPVKAESINADLAVEARRLFNLVSELDEHTRSQVFALLVWPRRTSAGSENAEIGVENGLEIDPDQKNVPYFLAPPAGVSETLLKQIESCIIEIYRMARVEYDRASGTASSAQSRQQNFEQTNLAIVDLAIALAAADLDTLYLVGLGLGCSTDELDKMTVSAAHSYDTEALQEELDAVVEAVTTPGLTMGMTFKAEVQKRLAVRMLPNLPADKRKTIEGEIDEAAKKAEQQAAIMEDNPLDPNGGEDPNAPQDGASQDGAPGGGPGQQQAA